MDNCEHVLAAVAELCVALLLAADDIRILATSREPAGVAGEARYRLAPLTLAGLDPAGIRLAGEAVTLFADRARRVDPHFTLTSGVGAGGGARGARIGWDAAGDRAGRGPGGGTRGWPSSLTGWMTGLPCWQVTDRRLFPGTGRWRRQCSGATAAARAREGRCFVSSRCSLAHSRWRPPRLWPVQGRSGGAAPGGLLAAGPAAGRARRAGPLFQCWRLSAPTGRDGSPGLVSSGEAAAALARFAVGLAEEAAAGLETSAGEVDAAQWLDAEDATVHHVLAWGLEHDPFTAVRLGHRAGALVVLAGPLGVRL